LIGQRSWAARAAEEKAESRAERTLLVPLQMSCKLEARGASSSRSLGSCRCSSAPAGVAAVRVPAGARTAKWPVRQALCRGTQGLLVRIAKTLNKLWRRRGKVFADRYHDRILATPRETRNALRYVLQNARKHAAEGREVAVPAALDTFSSAPWFDGFRESFTVRGLEVVVRPVTAARTWMLTIGWRRHGLLSVHEMPATG